jgi:hypothetical protein
MPRSGLGISKEDKENPQCGMKDRCVIWKHKKNCHAPFNAQIGTRDTEGREGNINVA